MDLCETELEPWLTVGYLELYVDRERKCGRQLAMKMFVDRDLNCG
jgi:hypothetical protein